MARVAINTGATPNDGTGDNLRAAGGIINNNFTELYTYLGAGSTTTLSAPIWNTTASGINTSRNVGLGTTNPRFTLEVGSVGASGTSLWVNGDARITGILTIGTSSITLNGSSNTINVGSGITINGNTGIISATQVYVGGVQVGSVSAGGTWAVTSAGIHTTKNVGIGTTNPTSALTVKGNTSLETLNVSGVSTFSDIYLGNGSAYLVYSGSNVVFTQPSGTDGSDDVGGFKFVTTDPGLPSSYETALSIYSAGSYWDRLVKVHRSLQVDNNITINGTSTFAGIVTVTGTTLFTKQLNVSGIATISGDGTNAYLRYGSSNAYTNFVTTYNVSQVGGVSLISADANGVALSADTTLNAAYWRIRTLPTGAEVNGALNVSGISSFRDVVNINPPSATPELNFGNGKLQIYHNGSTGVFRETAGFSGIYFQTDNEFKVQDDTGGKTRISANKNSSVDLYYNGNKKFETLGTGVTITGTTFTNQLSVSGVSTFSGDIKTNNSNIVLNDGDGGNNKIKLGAGSGGQDADCYISHTSAYGNVIQDLTGTGVRAITNNFRLSSPADISVSFFTASPTGSTELYYGSIGGYSSSKKLETLGVGVTITGTTFTNQLSVSGVSTFSGNVSVGIDTSTGLILTSPNGTRYRLIVADNGSLSTVAI